MDNYEIAIPCLGFVVIANAIYHSKSKEKAELIIELFAGATLMALSIYQIQDNSKKQNDLIASKDFLMRNVGSIREDRRTDSINTAAFQKFVRDSLGYERKGNKAVRVTNIKNAETVIIGGD